MTLGQRDKEMLKGIEIGHTASGNRDHEDAIISLIKPV